MNLPFRHRLGSQPQNSSKEKVASAAFFIANVPARLPCLYFSPGVLSPVPRQETAQSTQAAPAAFTGWQWEQQAGGDGTDLGG